VRPRNQFSSAGASSGIRRSITLLSAAVFLTVWSVGCHCGKQKEPPQAQDFNPLLQPSEQAMDIPAKQIVLPTYRLNVGDQLEIIYHVKHTVTHEDYRLKIEDALSIRFPFQTQYDQDVTVNSDGTVRLLLLGRVAVFHPSPDGNPEHAVGMTADELEVSLKKRYAEHIKNPELTVTVNKANIKIAELKRAITTAPRGQSRLMPINPDGTIDLPYIGTVMAFGKTIAELRSDINEAYMKADLEEIDVTVQMNAWASQRLFVLGEVRSPGAITMSTPISLVQAIAAAGGATPRGDQGNVLVIRRKGVPIPQGAVVNVDELMQAMKPNKDGTPPDFSKFRRDIWMQDMDIVYVPMTGLAQFDDWVDQVFTRGIRSIIPYSYSTNLNFGYDLHNEPSTIKTQNGSAPNVNIGLSP